MGLTRVVIRKEIKSLVNILNTGIMEIGEEPSRRLQSIQRKDKGSLCTEM